MCQQCWMAQETLAGQLKRRFTYDVIDPLGAPNYVDNIKMAWEVFMDIKLETTWWRDVAETCVILSHKSHTDWPQVEPRPLCVQTSGYIPEPQYGLIWVCGPILQHLMPVDSLNCKVMNNNKSKILSPQ